MMMNDDEEKDWIFYCYYCYCTIVVIIGPSYPFSTRACSVILYVTGNLMI